MKPPFRARTVPSVPVGTMPSSPGAGVTSPVHAEWTKLRTLPSSWLLLTAAVVLTVLVGTAAVSAVTTRACESAAACHEDTVKLSLTGVWLGQAAVLVLGALSMGAEYGTGTIRATLTAVPRRGAVLTAKSAVLAALTALAGTAAILASLLTARLILPGNGFTPEAGYPLPSLADPTTLRAAIGSVLCLVLVALLGLGLATLLRDTAGAITAGLGLLYVVPLLADLLADPTWKDRFERWAPMPAGLAVQTTRDFARLPIGPWPGLGVLAAYALGLLCVGAVAFRLRDAR